MRDVTITCHPLQRVIVPGGVMGALGILGFGFAGSLEMAIAARVAPAILNGSGVALRAMVGESCTPSNQVYLLIQKGALATWRPSLGKRHMQSQTSLINAQGSQRGLASVQGAFATLFCAVMRNALAIAETQPC